MMRVHPSSPNRLLAALQGGRRRLDMRVQCFSVHFLDGPMSVFEFNSTGPDGSVPKS